MLLKHFNTNVFTVSLKLNDGSGVIYYVTYIYVVSAFGDLKLDLFPIYIYVYVYINNIVGFHLTTWQPNHQFWGLGISQLWKHY